MHIAAVLRLVPDLTGELEIAENGADIDREWIDLKLNEFDDHALEEAILLKEATGAMVTALALDGEGADRLLQTALARGADSALKIAHQIEGAIASRSAAPLFAAAARQLGVDLIVTGVQTPDDLFGQLAPYLGAALDWPHVSAVSGVRSAGDAVLVQQEFSGGVSATLRVRLPAVLGVQTASQPIRYVSGAKLRQATTQKIASVATEAAPADLAAVVARLAVPDRIGGAAMLDGDAAAVAGKILDVLAARGLVKV